MNTVDVLRAIKILREAAPDDSTDMTLSMVHVFLLISENEGVLSRELSQLTDLSPGTVSNIIHTLSQGRKRDGTRRPGYGLITLTPNNDDLRIKNVYLTDKGKQILAKLQKL